jgi:hypothetical protein
MHIVMRLALGLVALVVPAYGQLQSEYKQADTAYYLGSDLFHADPGACIVTPADVTNMGGTYLFSTRPHAPQVIYLQQTSDWLEPITPPNMPASLNCPSSQMQVREPQGSVQVALPSAPADFQDVRRGMAIPNGSVLRTGDNGSVAVLFGGVDSVRLAPDTRAAVQMNLIGGVRDVEVDTRGGMVFSKVGQHAGESQVYAVHTPFGIASAHGTDYVTVVLPRRVDVWVAQGKVELASPDGARQVTASTGHEPLQVMRYPVISDSAMANTASAESLTALLNFIPMANQKLKVLANRSHDGDQLTATEKEYMGRIRQVTSLIKLATADAPVTPAPQAAPILPMVHLAPKQPKPLVVAQAQGTLADRPVTMTTTPATALKPVTKPAPTQVAKAKPASSTITEAGKKPLKIAQVKKIKHAKPTVLADSASGNLAPPPDENYLRAKPVDPVDLVAPPSVMSTLPPARVPSAPPVAATAAPEAPEPFTPAQGDPSSLGAQLNPFHAAAVAPEPMNPQGSSLGGTPSSIASPLGGVTGKVGDTGP